MNIKLGDTPPEETLHAPRILCLHGGGTNAEVMRLQCRSIIRALCPHFRCVFPDGPFFCAPHPNIIPVYEDFGPYRRWMRWKPVHAEVDDDTVIEEIHYQLRTAMEQDDKLGADGEWVGLLGFSQGAKLVTTILYESQLRMDEAAAAAANGREANGTNGTNGTNWIQARKKKREAVEGFAGGHWRFGVCMAGRPPIVSLREKFAAHPYMPRPGAISELGFQDLPEGMDKLRLPTIHVHGLADEGLAYHRQLLEDFCEPRTTKLIEWDGDHRLPLKSSDVNPIAEAIMKIAKAEGLV